MQFKRFALLVPAALVLAPLSSADATPQLACGFSVGEAVDWATLNVDVIVISDSGGMDSRISGFTQLGCTWEDYAAMFPDTPSEPVMLAPAESFLLAAAMEDPQFTEDVLVNGEWIPVFTVDPTETVVPIDLCIEECVDEQPAAPLTMLDSTWTGPRLGGASQIEVLIVFPLAPDTQATKDECNGVTMTDARNYLYSQFGTPINLECYITSTPDARWNTADSGGFHQTDPGGNLFESCRSYVDTKFAASVNDVHEIVYCWVREGAPNGAAFGDLATSAEKGIPPWPDHPNVQLAIHEMGHIFGASHYPDSGWKKYTCGSYHLHWWGWHYHTHKSVMNYCWLAWAGTKEFDSANAALVDHNIGHA